MQFIIAFQQNLRLFGTIRAIVWAANVPSFRTVALVSRNLARPKSRTLTPDLVRMMFPGFRSR